MERLLSLVRKTRQYNAEQFEKMAEDYILKAHNIFKELLETKPHYAEYKAIAVEILDCDIKTGTVEIGPFRYLMSDESFENDGCVEVERWESHEYILEHDRLLEEVNGFIEILKRKGFKCFFADSVRDSSVTALCPYVVF